MAITVCCAQRTPQELDDARERVREREALVAQREEGDVSEGLAERRECHRDAQREA